MAHSNNNIGPPEWFKQLMDATEKKIKLEERTTMIKERKAALEEKKAALEEKRVKIAANAEDAKMLTLNINSLDADARMIVQSGHYQMLERQKDELVTVADEDAVEAEVDADTEAAYGGDDTSLIGKHLAGMASPAGQ